MIDHYDWRGGREAMLRFGPETGPLVVIAMPLFEEANRTRAFVVTLCRALAAHGVASALPDLPGQGESLVPTEDACLGDWRTGFTAAAASIGERVYGVALRSGAAVDCEASLAGRWRLSPMSGATVLAELRRAEAAGLKVRGETIAGQDDGMGGPSTLLGGNRVSPSLFRALADDALVISPGPLRTVRLTSDPQPADRKVEAAPLWRRAEPGNDPALAALLADDISAWIVQCGG